MHWYVSAGRRQTGRPNRENPDACTRILIVEDDPGFRTMCEAAIRHDVLFEIVASCCCAVEAVAALERAEVDVALVDLGLPDSAARFHQSRGDQLASANVCPASQAGYDGIAADNVGLDNPFGACGVYRNGV
jgi:DNA-binding NarL/FixJ family response regulator